MSENKIVLETEKQPEVLTKPSKSKPGLSAKEVVTLGNVYYNLDEPHNLFLQDKIEGVKTVRDLIKTLSENKFYISATDEKILLSYNSKKLQALIADKKQTTKARAKAQAKVQALVTADGVKIGG